MKSSNFFDRILMFLPGIVFTFVRYFTVVAFALLTLGGHTLKNPIYLGIIFLLAVFGLWKVFDSLEQKMDSLSKRHKK